MSTYWQTVEYDENSIAWLVDDHNNRLCLEHGMRLQVFGVTLPAYPAVQRPEPMTRREGEGDGS